ncbi:MAG: hypothetical protein DRP02_13155 [Candidatus Gerdarchaeota archaeon]|nr:MAG: hypothetical protein DRP02_13155 [Candidatus Gerdarchaeota archaeon]RLI68779.1 MAG: hypothetical protein DRO63_02065 [Candidatus Gerdarchaeota archaeon]
MFSLPNEIIDALEKYIGKEVVLTGLAVRTKAGPAILLKDKQIVFVENLLEWPEKREGKQLMLKGILSKEKIIPDVVIEADGAISQGASGEQLILRDITFMKDCFQLEKQL